MESVALAVMAGEGAADVVVVILGEVGKEDLVDDREEVGERTNGWEGWCVGWAEGAPDGGEEQGVGDGKERDAAVEELRSQEPIGASHHAQGAGRGAIELEKLTDVVLAIFHGAPAQPCGSRSEGPSMRTVWQ